MLTILDQILCWIESFADLILIGLVDFANVAIVANAALLAGALALLPDMPSFPSLGSLDWLAWAVPIESFQAEAALLLTIFVGIFGVRIALRWLKAMS